MWFYTWVHFDYINVKEKRKGNKEWTSQRRGLLRAQDTELKKNKAKKTTTLKTKNMSNPTKKNETEQNKAKQKQTRRFFVYMNGNMFDF